MAGPIRERRSRLLGSALAASAGALVLAVGAPAVSADAVGPAPVDGVAGAAEPAPVAPTIVVEPSTGLSPGQRVTVTGTGFTANSSIGVAMCDDPLVDHASCDFSTAQIGRSDDAGGLRLTYTVVDTMGDHTCVPVGCLIGATNLAVPAEIANQVSLGFVAARTATPDGTAAPLTAAGGDVAPPRELMSSAPVAAQATPTISVSPSSGLTNGQTVTISGSGFTPNSSIGVSMCDDPFVDGSSCDFSTAQIGRSDGSGGITLTYTVVDTIRGHSCVPTGCLIGAANLNVANEFANRVSLGFGAGSPATPAPPPSTPGSTPTSGAPGASPVGAGSTPTSLATTGVPDSLALLLAAGFALTAVGAALTLTARRARDLARG